MVAAISAVVTVLVIVSLEIWACLRQPPVIRPCFWCGNDTCSEDQAGHSGQPICADCAGKPLSTLLTIRIVRRTT